MERGQASVETAALWGLVALLLIALGALLAPGLAHSLVRALGSPLPADTLEESDLILPPEDSSMAEVRGMLTDEGLIPG